MNLETFGFHGGISFRDNITKQFVGFGSSCEDEDKVPCYIATTTKNSGCYIPCGTEKVDKNFAFYLASNPKLTWIPTDVNRMRKIPDSIRLKGNNFTFMFGRSFHKGNYRLGKIITNSKINEFRMQTSDGEITLKNNFEVLSCSSEVEFSCGIN